jgi:hypothetical protein
MINPGVRRPVVLRGFAAVIGLALALLFRPYL